MNALDLRLAAPRSPREELAGLVFLPRVIDKLRATLPGGDAGAYFPYYGLSALFARITGIDLQELREVVAQAADDDEVGAWVQRRINPEIASKCNHVLSTFSQEKIPAAFRATFDSVAPAELRGEHSNIFDLLEADDAQTFTQAEAEIASKKTVP